MIKEITTSSEDKMKKSLEVVKKSFQSMKAGRANAAMLDKILVDYYGTPTNITGVATVTIPEPRTISIQPWEKAMIKVIEKAIQKSDLGINPNNDGTVIRLTIPELTEETRKNLVKQVKTEGDKEKVAIRNIRRDANEKLKTIKKDGTHSEDDIKKTEDEVQKLTDSYIKEIDKLIELKEKEIMTV